MQSQNPNVVKQCSVLLKNETVYNTVKNIYTKNLKSYATYGQIMNEINSDYSKDIINSGKFTGRTKEGIEKMFITAQQYKKDKGTQKKNIAKRILQDKVFNNEFSNYSMLYNKTYNKGRNNTLSMAGQGIVRQQNNQFNIEFNESGHTYNSVPNKANKKGASLISSF